MQAVVYVWVASFSWQPEAHLRRRARWVLNQDGLTEVGRYESSRGKVGKSVPGVGNLFMLEGRINLAVIK